MGDKCPTCEQTVQEDFKQTLIAEEAGKISFAQEKMSEITTRIEEIKRNNERFEHKNKMQREWEDLYRSIDRDLTVALLDKGVLEERLAGVRADLVSIKESVAETTKENERRTKQNTPNPSNSRAN